MTGKPRNLLALSPVKRDAYLGEHWREHLFSRDEARVLEIDTLVQLQHWQEILDQADELRDWATRLAEHFRKLHDNSITASAYCRIDSWADGVLAKATFERGRQLDPNPPKKGRKPQRRDPATWTEEERARFTPTPTEPATETDEERLKREVWRLEHALYDPDAIAYRAAKTANPGARYSAEPRVQVNGSVGRWHYGVWDTQRGVWKVKRRMLQPIAQEEADALNAAEAEKQEATSA